jgi:hypothetical protein
MIIYSEFLKISKETVAPVEPVYNHETPSSW